MRTYTLLALVLACSRIGTADFIVEDVPSWAGDEATSHSQWESFNGAVGVPNFPDIAGGPSTMLFNFEEGAFITGSGNIYNQNAGLNIHLYGAGEISQAVLNVATMGFEFNYDSFVLVDAAFNTYLPTFLQINHAEEIPDMGSIINLSVVWDLPESISGEWAFMFTSEGPHTSLDAVSLYTTPVPGPGGLALVILAGMTAGSRRRRA